MNVLRKTGYHITTCCPVHSYESWSVAHSAKKFFIFLAVKMTLVFRMLVHFWVHKECAPASFSSYTSWLPHTWMGIKQNNPVLLDQMDPILIPKRVNVIGCGLGRVSRNNKCRTISSPGTSTSWSLSWFTGNLMTTARLLIVTAPCPEIHT